jgi:hypothetical protein
MLVFAGASLTASLPVPDQQSTDHLSFPPDRRRLPPSSTYLRNVLEMVIWCLFLLVFSFAHAVYEVRSTPYDPLDD